VALPLALGLASGCGSEDEAAPTLDASRLSPACFSGGTTPQLDLAGPTLNWTWNDPHVLKVGSEYWMYASATDYFAFPVRLYRLVSSDGITWTLNPTTAILDVGAAGSWDAGGVETPAVVHFGGQYHLFYTGYPYPVGHESFSVMDFRVGHASSSDGITWTRAAGNPIVAPSGVDADPSNDFRAFIVGEPGPVVFDGALHVYFTAVGADADLGTSLQVIGVTTSADGAAWSTPELALRPDQDLYPRDQDWVGYSTPNGIVLDGQMHLFFDVAHQPSGGDWLQRRLHHARSPDGRTRWTHDGAAIRANTDFPWTGQEIRSPHALLDGSTLRLYFAGHDLTNVDDLHFAVGMMTCDLASR
jgi:predicted GH43/DUF377 family glycosyl hydrolase